MEIKMNTTPGNPQVEPVVLQETASGQSPVEQFKQGHPAPQMSKEDMDKHKDDMLKEIKKDLPFLRQKEEYDRLQVAQLEQQVMLGQRSAKEVPGLLGLELQVREIMALESLTQWKNEMDRRIEAVKAHDEEMKKAQEQSQPETPTDK